MSKFTNHSEPTYENQLWQARKLAHDKGIEELRRHMLVGEMCHCGGCFCCAALQVYRELKPTLSDPEMVVKSAIGILWEKAVNSGDGFRQWFYPNLPENYETNPEARAEAIDLYCRGKSAQMIADAIYSKHT